MQVRAGRGLQVLLKTQDQAEGASVAGPEQRDANSEKNHKKTHPQKTTFQVEGPLASQTGENPQEGGDV